MDVFEIHIQWLFPDDTPPSHKFAFAVNENTIFSGFTMLTCFVPFLALTVVDFFSKSLFGGILKQSSSQREKICQLIIETPFLQK